MVRQAHHPDNGTLSLSKAGLTMKWTTLVALNRVIPFALSPSKGEHIYEHLLLRVTHGSIPIIPKPGITGS